MTEIEELSDDDSFDPTPAPPQSLDDDGRCHHRHVYDDPEEAYLRRCACSAVRYYICQFCSTIINLAHTELVWPHTCCDCRRPACVPCANEMRRVDHKAREIVCYKCDTTPDARRAWMVMYRTSLLDRDKRTHVSIRPHPAQFLNRDDAAKGALAYLPIVVPSVLSADAVEALAKGMRSVYKGWINSPELRSGYEVLKVEIGLFPLHSVNTELLKPPTGVRKQ